MAIDGQHQRSKRPEFNGESRPPPKPVPKPAQGQSWLAHSPLEKTPHNARVIGVSLMAAVVTLLEMAAENSGAADLDRGHNTALRYRKRSGMLLTIGFAVAAKHIRYFKLGAIHVPELEVLWWGGLGLGGNWLWE
jgi:hypothetical protein